MSWHYAAKKVETEYGTDYVLCEVFPEFDNAYAEDVTVVAESARGLAEWLRVAADDVEKHSVIEEGS